MASFVPFLGSTYKWYHMILPLSDFTWSSNSYVHSCSCRQRCSVLFCGWAGPTGLPWWLSGTEYTCQCKRCEFSPWAGKTPWRRTCRPTPGFLPGRSRGQRSLAGCSPWAHERVWRRLVAAQQVSRCIYAPHPYPLFCLWTCKLRLWLLPSVNCAAVNTGIECDFKMCVYVCMDISYDKPRQHIQKQRHHFPNGGLYSQNCGFSSSHVRDGP